MADPRKGTGTGGRRTGKSAASSLIHRTDLVLTLAILAICGVVYYLTTGFEDVSALLADNVPPEWFPRLMIWSIVVLSLLLPFEHLFLEGGKKKLDEDRSVAIPRMAIYTAIVLVIVVASIDLIGMALAMVFACVALPLLWSERRFGRLALFAILFPAAVALLFSQILGIYFEPGALGLSLG